MLLIYGMLYPPRIIDVFDSLEYLDSNESNFIVIEIPQHITRKNKGLMFPFSQLLVQRVRIQYSEGHIFQNLLP